MRFEGNIYYISWKISECIETQTRIIIHKYDSFPDKNPLVVSNEEHTYII